MALIFRITLAACGCLAASAALAGPAHRGFVPDSLEGLPIARIEIHARTIFDPVPPGRLSHLYEAANRLHIRTREKTIREQLLMKPRQPWFAARGYESRRKLRSLDFLEPSVIHAAREGDSAVVHVETHDGWSTSPEFNLESADGKRYGSLGLTERNFLGLGKAYSVTYRNLPRGNSRGISYSDPSLQGTRIQLRYSASDGATGAGNEFSVGQPFYAEDATRSYDFQWSRSTSIAALYQRANEVARFNRRQESWSVSAGAGHRSGTLIRRIVGSFESDDRRFGPTQIENPGLPVEFTGGEASLRLRRIMVEGRLWRPQYIERDRVNGFTLVEDFDVGSSLSAGVGYAPRLLGSSQDEGFARARMAAGVVTPIGFGQLTATASSRLKTIPTETVGQVDVRFVQQSHLRQTFVIAARGIAGINPARDFEVAAGGLNGLRAYPVTSVAGRKLWRFNAENRWTVADRLFGGLTVGTVMFTDAARAWGPGSGGADWFVDSGAGLRLSLPQWSLGQVLRIDLAWPIEPSRNGERNPVLTFGSSQAF